MATYAESWKPSEKLEASTNDSSIAFMLDLYRSSDVTSAREIKRLRFEDGIVPSCKEGCYACCSQPIFTHSIEVKAVVWYIQQFFTKAEIESLRSRTVRWHQWDRIRRGDNSCDDLAPHYQMQYCPLLVNGGCGVYETRPLICRRFYVYSNPSACLMIQKRGKKHLKALVMSSVLSVTERYESRIKTYLKSQNMDYQRSTILLPQELAAQMNWDVFPSS